MIEEFNHEGLTIKIDYADFSESPREWDNLGTMVCFHMKYSLGDSHNFALTGTWEKVKKDIIKTNGTSFILPLYLYDHSGITIRTTAFQDRWDSMQVGFIFVSKKEARKVYGPLGKATIKKVFEVLESEVKTYDQYLRNDIFWYGVYRGEELIDSCSGFYDLDEARNEAIDYANIEIEKMERERPTREREALEAAGQLAFNFEEN